jgi:hypothetical protein
VADDRWPKVLVRRQTNAVKILARVACAGHKSSTKFG